MDLKTRWSWKAFEINPVIAERATMDEDGPSVDGVAGSR